MDEQLEKNLVEKYPIIFRDYGGDIRKTCMGWGMACGDGWYLLINDMCQDVMDTIGKKDIEVVAHQVKEKLGGLRFYHGITCKPSIFSGFIFWFRGRICKMGFAKQYWKAVDFRKKFFRSTNEKINDIISNAEYKSYKICEICGNPGERRGRGWIRTLCDSCDEKD